MTTDAPFSLMTDAPFNLKDVRIDIFRRGSSSSVRVTHVPSGLFNSVDATDIGDRRAREQALRLLAQQVTESEQG